MPLISRIGPDQLYSRRWQLLALTSVGAFMGPLDGSIVSVALPQMGRSLHLSFTGSIWVQAVYLLVMAVLLIPLGRLADQRGRVRYYLAGIAIFTVGSLCSALSMNAAWLIASRALQGTGAALLVATSAAIVTAVFPPQERGRALGINVMAVYLGLSVGPPLGGFLTDHFGWRSIFLVNLPIGIAVAACGYLLLPRHERGDERAMRPDPLGTGLWGLTLACLLVPLTFAAQWGWTSPRTLGLLAIAAASLAVFVSVELRARPAARPRPAPSQPPLCGRQLRRPAQLHGSRGDHHPDGGLPRGRTGTLGGSHRLADARPTGGDGCPQSA